jgi:hypothetical protein
MSVMPSSNCNTSASENSTRICLKLNVSNLWSMFLLFCVWDFPGTF